MHTSPRDANVVGAFAVVLQDLLADAAELAGGPTAATALIAVGGRAAGSSIDALARILGLSHSGTVRLVDRLVRDSLVERRRGADQRSAALVLTPAGRRLARRVLERREANVHSVLALLTDDQQAAIVEIAARVVGETRSEERRICRLCDVEACGRPRRTCPRRRTYERKV
jgi:MarR family transcriptional regulator, negative regulator of the multidrug operon emrRAB